MAGPPDEPMAEGGADRVAREVGRGDGSRDDGIDMRGREADADQGADIAVGELDQADAQDERADGGEDTGHVVSSVAVRFLESAAELLSTSVLTQKCFT